MSNRSLTIRAASRVIARVFAIRGARIQPLEVEPTNDARRVRFGCTNCSHLLIVGRDVVATLKASRERA